MFMLSLALLQSPAAPMAFAANDDEPTDLEESDADKGGKKHKTTSTSAKKDAQVREIVRGFYAKANVGGALWVLPPFSQSISSGTLVMLGVGDDFVDSEHLSMAWEVGLAQGLHNGIDNDGDNVADGCLSGGACTEGDLRTYTLQANYEISTYVTRRVGIGARVGGGVMYSPLLMNRDYFNQNVLPMYGGQASLQGSPVPMAFGGPTIEYYTKLSHFSVGVDVDAAYYIGWSLAINASGALKYTF